MPLGFQLVKDVAATAVKKLSNQLMNFVAAAFGRVLAARWLQIQCGSEKVSWPK